MLFYIGVFACLYYFIIQSCIVFYTHLSIHKYSTYRKGLAKSWYYNVYWLLYMAIQNQTIELWNCLMIFVLYSNIPPPSTMCLVSFILSFSISKETGEGPMEKHPASPDNRCEKQNQANYLDFYLDEPTCLWVSHFPEKGLKAV